MSPRWIWLLVAFIFCSLINLSSEVTAKAAATTTEDDPKDNNDEDDDDSDDEADDPDDLYVDLTHELLKDIPRYPKNRAFRMNVTFKGKTKEGHWYQNEEIWLGTHTGTHLDAPVHFWREGWSVSEIPFDCLMERPVVVVDLRAKVFLEHEVLPETQLTTRDLLNFETAHGRIPNDSVVLVLTGWGRYWENRNDYLGTTDNDEAKQRYPGVSVDAARWLTRERDICGVGIDTISIDYGKSPSKETHVLLASKNKYILENVANLEKLPPTGAILNVGVMKIGGEVSGAPARLLARLPEPDGDDDKKGDDDDTDDDDDDDDSASSSAISKILLILGVSLAGAAHLII